MPKRNAAPRIAQGWLSPTFLPIDSPGEVSRVVGLVEVRRAACRSHLR